MDKTHEDKTDDHEEEPSEDLIRTHDESTIYTGRIDPCLGKGADIFPEPDEESDKWESEGEIHRVVFIPRFEIYPCPSKSEKYPYEYNVPEVPDKMMGEEIDIDRERDEDRIDLFRIILESKLEDPPDSRDITPDCWVHESCKEGNSQYPDREISWILPGSDRWMCLKYLHNSRDDMKYQDHSDLAPGFESCHDEENLEDDRRYEEEVISIEDIIQRIIVFRCYKEYDEVQSEYTGVCLLRDESEEVVKIFSHIIFSVFRYQWYISSYSPHLLHMSEIFVYFPYGRMSLGVRIREGYRG
jgi:hypothetical protein